MHDILNDLGQENLIADPKRPGPNYYDDCKKFNWVDVLVQNHKSELLEKGLNTDIYNNDFSQDELMLLKKLKDSAVMM